MGSYSLTIDFYNRMTHHWYLIMSDNQNGVSNIVKLHQHPWNLRGVSLSKFSDMAPHVLQTSEDPMTYSIPGSLYKLAESAESASCPILFGSIVFHPDDPWVNETSNRKKSGSSGPIWIFFLNLPICSMVLPGIPTGQIWIIHKTDCYGCKFGTIPTRILLDLQALFGQRVPASLQRRG